MLAGSEYRPGARCNVCIAKPVCCRLPVQIGNGYEREVKARCSKRLDS